MRTGVARKLYKKLYMTITEANAYTISESIAQPVPETPSAVNARCGFETCSDHSLLLLFYPAVTPSQ